MIAVVLGLSFVVLLVAFRSLLVPLQAAVTNLLCVAAAFGVLTAAFQWGWGIGIFGMETDSDTVPIASYVPLMMFAVLFGLSMDYQVFLLSQIAEHREEGQDDRSAVASGLANSAPVIVAAALIMIGVFGSFVLNGDPTVKQFGVGLAVAVLLAATMVLVLAPALLVVMGRRTWWLPPLLARVVPEVDIEGRSQRERWREPTHRPLRAVPAPDRPPHRLRAPGHARRAAGRSRRADGRGAAAPRSPRGSDAPALDGDLPRVVAAVDRVGHLGLGDLRRRRRGGLAGADRVPVARAAVVPVGRPSRARG